MFLFEVVAYDVIPPLDMLQFLIRSQLLSKYYGSIVSAVQRYGIQCHNPKFCNELFDQKPFFTASKVATYSVSVVESAMMGYLKLFQITTPPLQMNIYPDIDFQT